MRMHVAAFHMAKRQWLDRHRSMSVRWVREKVGHLRSMEGTERERVCRRWEWVNMAWGWRLSTR